MLENKKKIFPKIHKKIKSFLTDESKWALSWWVAFALFGSSILFPNNAFAAACTWTYACDDYVINTSRAHVNSCIASNYASPIRPNVTDATVRYCWIVSSLPSSHLSLNINWHISSSPLLNATFWLGLNSAPWAHSSHCNRRTAGRCCSCG